MSLSHIYKPPVHGDNFISFLGDRIESQEVSLNTLINLSC